MNKQPNLFLIGAMRSGSTTLHLMLEQHPEIYMSPIKEPMFYYAEDLRRQIDMSHGYQKEELKVKLEEVVNSGKHRERDSYNYLFKDSSKEIYLGESSHYLYNPQVAKTIYNDSPNAKIVVSLRNPVDRLHSEWLLLRRMGLTSGTFSSFIKEGCVFDSSGVLTSITKQSKITKGYYSKLLKPWFETFGREQVKIVLFDDLREDPKRTIQEIYDWLGVDPTYKPVTLRAQQGGVPKNQFLFSVLTSSGSLRKSVKKIVPGILRERIRTLMFSSTLEKPEMDDDINNMLKKVYEADINELEVMLAVSLDKWK